MYGEGCWLFGCNPGVVRGQRVDIAFAVYLQARRPVIRAAVLDADTDEVLGPGGTGESVVI
jgi:hypothetical protein